MLLGYPLLCISNQIVQNSFNRGVTTPEIGSIFDPNLAASM